MRRFYCDLHMHSCLSPCGDDTMTPSMAAGMQKLAGMDVAALTDHNTAKNCPAFFEACKMYGLSPMGGMELTTAEEVHLVCITPDLETALRFDEAVHARRVLIKNRTRFFGNQYIMDAEDNILGEDEFLLPNATTLSLEEAFKLANEYGMLCYPAHVDREANGIIAVLGDFPDRPAFRFAEFRDKENIEPYMEKYPNLRGLTTLFGSDAHRPDAVEDADFSIEVPDGDDEPAEAIFKFLKGEMV